MEFPMLVLAGRTDAAAEVLIPPYKQPPLLLHVIPLPQRTPAEMLRPSGERSVPSGISGVQGMRNQPTSVTRCVC